MRKTVLGQTKIPFTHGIFESLNDLTLWTHRARVVEHSDLRLYQCPECPSSRTGLGPRLGLLSSVDSLRSHRRPLGESSLIGTSRLLRYGAHALGLTVGGRRLLAVATSRCLAVQPSLFRFVGPMARVAIGRGMWRPTVGLAGSLLSDGIWSVPGAAMADFRPSVLFIPGVLGLFYGAAARRPRTAMTWALVALSGRQEAAWLIGLSGLCLWLIPWPNISTGPDWWSRWQRGRANQIAWLAMGVGLLALGGWILTKDQMFFHFNPTQPEATPRLAPEHLQDRWDYVTRLARSGWILGLISPGSLLAMIPIGHEMAGTAREWPQMVGPAAHYSAFWLPFVTASGIAGACRIRKWGLPILVLLNTLAFPWVSPRTGDPSLQRLAEPISADDRVAADYDSIHLVSGRRVLWNVEQLNLPDDERPYEWNQAWPLKTDDVDVIILRRDHPLTADLVDWTIIAETETHLSLRLR